MKKPRMGRGYNRAPSIQEGRRKKHCTMKLKAEYGGGSDSIFFAPKTGEFLSYEMGAMHTRFGGKKYYVSHSGMSGAGFLCPPPSDPLIEVGSYRTDAALNPHPALAPIHDCVQVYVPYKSHGGIDTEKPVVLVDGLKVAMVADHGRVWDVLERWSEPEAWKNVEVPAYDAQG